VAVGVQPPLGAMELAGLCEWGAGSGQVRDRGALEGRSEVPEGLGLLSEHAGAQRRPRRARRGGGRAGAGRSVSPGLRRRHTRDSR
jgi:hypothetical protein